MLLKITNTCHAACFHCMENARPKSAHMDFPTLINAVKFIHEIDPNVLIVSGGEPTNHPHFHEFINYIRTYFKGIIIIASNGLFINEGKGAINAIINPLSNDKSIHWQITNDSRYYPKALDENLLKYATEKYKQVQFINELMMVYPQGRATTSLKITDKNTSSKGSRCFNLRSIICSGLSLKAAISTLEDKLKFCQPNISYDGNIGMGESSTCPPISNVNNYSLSTIEKSIRESQCNECKMITALPQLYKNAINFVEI